MFEHCQRFIVAVFPAFIPAFVGFAPACAKTERIKPRDMNFVRVAPTAMRLRRQRGGSGREFIRFASRGPHGSA